MMVPNCPPKGFGHFWDRCYTKCFPNGFTMYEFFLNSFDLHGCVFRNCGGHQGSGFASLSTAPPDVQTLRIGSNDMGGVQGDSQSEIHTSSLSSETHPVKITLGLQPPNKTQRTASKLPSMVHDHRFNLDREMITPFLKEH